jgi:hypothetical protein
MFSVESSPNPYFLSIPTNSPNINITLSELPSDYDPNPCYYRPLVKEEPISYDNDFTAANAESEAYSSDEEEDNHEDHSIHIPRPEQLAAPNSISTLMSRLTTHLARSTTNPDLPSNSPPAAAAAPVRNHEAFLLNSPIQPSNSPSISLHPQRSQSDYLVSLASNSPAYSLPRHNYIEANLSEYGSMNEVKQIAFSASPLRFSYDGDCTDCFPGRLAMLGQTDNFLGLVDQITTHAIDMEDLNNYDLNIPTLEDQGQEQWSNPDCHALPLIPSQFPQISPNISSLTTDSADSDAEVSDSAAKKRRHPANSTQPPRSKRNKPTEQDCPRLDDSITPDKDPEIIIYNSLYIRLPRAAVNGEMMQFARASDLCNPLSIVKGNNGREFKYLSSANKCWFKVTSDKRNTKGEAGINISEKGIVEWIGQWSNRRLKAEQAKQYKHWLLTVLIPKLAAINHGRSVLL